MEQLLTLLRPDHEKATHLRWSWYLPASWLSLQVSIKRKSGRPQQIASNSDVVLGIDKEKGVVTISRSPPALNMMAMTMGYFVKDRNLLSNLQPMQRSSFRSPTMEMFT
jgi:hypothetical protein